MHHQKGAIWTINHIQLQLMELLCFIHYTHYISITCQPLSWLCDGICLHWSLTSITFLLEVDLRETIEWKHSYPVWGPSVTQTLRISESIFVSWQGNWRLFQNLLIIFLQLTFLTFHPPQVIASSYIKCMWLHWLLSHTWNKRSKFISLGPLMSNTASGSWWEPYWEEYYFIPIKTKNMVDSVSIKFKCYFI